MTTKFQPPRGTRDFMPEDMVRREYIFNRIRVAYERYGFRPMDTPAFESWELLGAKGGGGEAIRNEVYVFKDKGDRELGLRFDLTVPTARVVASNPQLPRPFKRYQMGPVWRYDNPQAGRFREFWQADIDTFGVSGMQADAEIIAATINALTSLGFKDFVVRLNNRKILNGLVESTGIDTDKIPSVFRALDKLEKFGENNFVKDLENAGVGGAATKKLLSLIKTKGSPVKILSSTKTKFASNKSASEGLKELQEIMELCKSYGIELFVEIDFSLVRGLDYYTGPIFEITAGEGIGSVAGGGRYDKLIGTFGGREEPAVGISIGVERIYDVMEKGGMFKKLKATKTKVFVAAVGEEKGVQGAVLKTATRLRNSGIPVETDIMGRKLKQCLEYSEKTGIPYAIIIGEKELSSGCLTLRDMAKREQNTLSIDDIVKKLSEL